MQYGPRLCVINLCALLSSQPKISFLYVVTDHLILEGFASNANLRLLRRGVLDLNVCTEIKLYSSYVFLKLTLKGRKYRVVST